MDTSPLQSAKLAILSVVGLSKDALHIYVGLAVFLAAAWLLRRPLRSPLPWLAALAVACLGELLDAIDDTRSFGYWRVGASMHDILNTLFWPTALLLLARFTRIFDIRRGDDAP
jgi:hypothetical protein